MDLSCKFSLDKKGRLWGEQNASYANSEMSIKDKIFRGTLLLLVRTNKYTPPTSEHDKSGSTYECV